MLVEFKKLGAVQFKDLKVGDVFIDEYHDVFLKIVDVEQAGTTRNALRLLDCDVWTCHPSEMVVPVVNLNVIFVFLKKWYDDDMPHDLDPGLLGIAPGPCGSVNRLMESEEQKMEEHPEELPYNIFPFEE